MLVCIELSWYIFFPLSFPSIHPSLRTRHTGCGGSKIPAGLKKKEQNRSWDGGIRTHFHIHQTVWALCVYLNVWNYRTSFHILVDKPTHSFFLLVFPFLHSHSVYWKSANCIEKLLYHSVFVGWCTKGDNEYRLILNTYYSSPLFVFLDLFVFIL